VVRPFLLVNPRSGDGAPSADDLAREAELLGVEARVLGREDDAASLARDAVERGASAIGVAGGDGSLAGVAAVALEADLPLVPVPFGTRNHFAQDAGFDADDPDGALAAFGGEERRVDVGLVGGRVFLNNVSLGLYASLVHDPAHRTKNRLVALGRMLPAAFGRSRRPLDVSFELEGRSERHSALVVLVANNDYRGGGFSERERLDEGRLHAYVVEAESRRTLVALLARAVSGRLAAAPGWAHYAAGAFRIESARERVHAAVDGEPVVLTAPLEFEIRPRALRVLVPPRSRDGNSGETARR
jgi:diacylglycerol kinase family enzyme